MLENLLDEKIASWHPGIFVQIMHNFVFLRCLLGDAFNFHVNRNQLLVRNVTGA